MDDLISRQDAVIQLSHNKTGDDDCDVIIQRDIETIKQLPSALPRWIPCSERLPDKKEKTYWVCLEGCGQCQCRWTNDMYGLGTNEWSKWGWHIMDKPQYSTIVAWMPLPKSYKGEKE